MSKPEDLRAAVGAKDRDLEIVVIPDSEDEQEEEEGEEELQQFSHRPHRAIHAPKRYTPVKGSTYRPRGRYAVQHILLPHKGPEKAEAAHKPSKNHGSARPVGRPRKIQRADAYIPPVKVDPAAASLGLQLSGQYGQLLLQVQALFSSLHPGNIYTQPQDLLAELTGLAAHKAQLQQLQGSMQDIMDTILHMLPLELQQQAQKALAEHSPATGGQQRQAHTSPGDSSATLQQQRQDSSDHPAAVAATAPAAAPEAAGVNAEAATGTAAAGRLLAAGYGSPVVSCPMCLQQEGLCVEACGASESAGHREVHAWCKLCGWGQQPAAL